MAVEKKLTIVSTCTNQKRGSVSGEFHLSKFAGRFHRDSARAWVTTLEATRAGIPARDLYLGSHWRESLACEVSAEEQGIDGDLWVLSAGYGLIASSELTTPYAASFAAGADSIQNLNWPSDFSPDQKAREWWNLLHRYRKRDGLVRFSILAKSRQPLLIILSPEYYNAVEPEIIDLISEGVNVLIVSAGLYRNLNSASPVVRPHILPFSDSFKQVDDYLNKTNVSLNARLGTWLVRNYSDALWEGVDTVTPILREISNRLPAMKRKEVNRMSDDEVMEFIGRNFSGSLNSATRLLRHLRGTGRMSCEQKRFGTLFRRYQQSIQNDLFGHE
ncbi:MAG: hypothetical protein ACI8UO_003233 [Verrucomicrobiales bacterium]|jgi:hypothetical protein